MRALDLYCGVGAYTLALKEAGFLPLWAADRDEWRREVYKRNHGPTPMHDVDEMLAVVGAEADLWMACIHVAEMRRLVSEHVSKHRPKWLLLETVREPVTDILESLGAMGYTWTTWDACGRRFVAAGPAALPTVPVEFLQRRLQHPDVDARNRVSLEDQEEALGLPRGYTDCCGATERQRASVIGATSYIPHLVWVFRALLTADAQ